MRPTPADIAAKATAELKEARRLFQAGKGTFDWGTIETIIARCIANAEEPPAPMETKVAEVTTEAIYAVYPRKVGKLAAMKAIAKAAMTLREKEPDPLAYLLARTQLYATATSIWPEEEKKYIPHPATWFNQGRYDDNPREWERGNQAQPKARDYSTIS